MLHSVVNPLYFENANENVKQIDLISTFYDNNLECVFFLQHGKIGVVVYI